MKWYCTGLFVSCYSGSSPKEEQTQLHKNTDDLYKSR
jgi:hypothetical protein